MHRDKARSHTSQSRIPFLEKIVQDTGIKTIPFTDFPVKSPDASPKDFCAFGLLNLHYLNAELQCFVDFGKLLERSGTKKKTSSDVRKIISIMEIAMQNLVKNENYQTENLEQ